MDRPFTEVVPTAEHIGDARAAGGNGTSSKVSRADALTEAVTLTIDTIDRQLDLIAARAPGTLLDKQLVMQSLTAHKRRLEKALSAVEQHDAAPAAPENSLTIVDSVPALPKCTRCGAPARWTNQEIQRQAEQAVAERAFPATDGYFVYDRAGGHVEFYDTDAERDAAHREAIAEYRRDAAHDQEWPMEVEGIVSGVVTHMTGELKAHEDSYEFEPRAVAAQARASSPNAAGVEGAPRYTEWLHLRAHGAWSNGVPEWARDYSGRMNDFTAVTAVIEELAALARAPRTDVAGAVAAGDAREPNQVYVEVRQCCRCDHIGINDGHDTDSACGHSCGWSGPTPTEDRCPGCGEKNCMGVACPKCSGLYTLLVEGRFIADEVATPPSADAAAAPADAQAVEAVAIPEPTDDVLCQCGWEKWNSDGSYVDRGTATARYRSVAAFVLERVPAPPAPAPAPLLTRQEIAEAWKQGGSEAAEIALRRAAARPTDDQLWDQTLRERDEYHEAADKLAAAIAKHFGVDIGEHSNVSCTWNEALEVIENAVSASAPVGLTDAARDVLAERRRQVGQEGWTPAHDDEHANGELATAAGAYALFNDNAPAPFFWPWDASWWKPTGRRRNLVKAGALILAEIERLDRALLKGGKQ